MTDPLMTEHGAAEPKVYDVVVSVGTDHHPFDRIVLWADRWAALHPDRTVFVQRGASAAPHNVSSADIVGHAELLRMFSSCLVVVSHGGPSTVMDARASGRLPVVVARDPDRGEHIDGHQIRFADHLELHGLARLAGSEFEFRQLLDEAMVAPENFGLAEADADAPSGVVTFGAVVDGLLGVTTPIERPRR